MGNQKDCLDKMDKIIEELQVAKLYILQSEIENVEGELINALEENEKLLHYINEIQRYEKHKEPTACDKTGAKGLSITSNLQRNYKYITQREAVISWRENNVSICEIGTPPNKWGVYGNPLVIKDVTGEIKQVPTPNVLVFLEDGSSLIITTDEQGNINLVRFLNRGEATFLSSYFPIPLNKTEVYTNDVNKNKVAKGTADNVFGIRNIF